MLDNNKPGAANAGFNPIAVADWKPYERGSLRGFLTLSLASGFLIHNCKLFESNEGRWVKLPDQAFKKRDGNTGYAPIVELLSRDLEQDFQQAVLAALDRYLGVGDDE